MGPPFSVSLSFYVEIVYGERKAGEADSEHSPPVQERGEDADIRAVVAQMAPLLTNPRWISERGSGVKLTGQGA